jgi:hypothetical protein
VAHAARLGSLLIAVFTASTSLHAQAAGDSAVYNAVIGTPLGALPRPLDVSIVGERPGAPSVHFAYGMRTFRGNDVLHSVGVGTTFGLSESSALGVTAGYWFPDCDGDGCNAHVMGEVSVAQGMARMRLGEGVWSHLNIGLRAETGAAIPAGGFLWAARAILPVSLVPGERRGPRFAPYVAPGVAIGLERDDERTEAGITPTLSAGLGLLDVFGLRLGVGIERAWLRGGGNWMVGASVGSSR